MSARTHLRSGRPAIDLLEQAVALLRRTPLSIIFFYYLGAVPFWLAILYFAADMSRNAFAGERIAGPKIPWPGGERAGAGSGD